MSGARYAMLLPEAALALVAVVIFFITLAGGPVRGRRARRVLNAGLLVAAAAAAWTLAAGAADDFLFGAYRIDALTQASKLLVALLALAAVLTGRQDDGQWSDARSDGPLFTGVTLLGALMVLSAADLVVLAIALGATAAAFTGAVWSGGRRAGTESPVRRIVAGMLATGFLMLAGVTVLAGVTGATRIDDVGRALAVTAPAVWLAGFGLVLWGFAAFLGVPPLQSGFAQLVTRAAPGAAALAAGPLWAAAALALVRVAAGAATYGAGAGIGLTLAGVVVAGFGAARAGRAGRDVREMLAALGLLQTGTLLFLLATQSPAAWSGAILLVAAAAAGQAAALLPAARLAHAKGRLDAADVTGLAAAEPVAGVALTLGIAALAGLPPAAGFTARWAGGAAALQDGWDLPLALLLLATLAALRGVVPLLRAVWSRRPAHGTPVGWRPGDRVALVLLALALLLGGIVPGPVLAAASRLAGLLKP